jgi:hypothetical protein
MKDLAIKIGVVFLLIGLAFAYGRYSAPKSVETKEVIKKETEYITREIKQPDGTVIKEVINRDLTQKATDNKVVYQKPQYKVNIIPQYNFDSNKVTYGASVEKRISGPIFVGIYANTEKAIGVSVGIEF